jgi:hypothetical protein
MKLEDKINAFAALGYKISRLTDSERDTIAVNAAQLNPWFTNDSVATALSGINHFLKKDTLSNWAAQYPIEHQKSKTVGVAMAGNIPLVGFHDLLCILLCGHQLIAKKSSQDSYLTDLLINWLIEIEPRFKSNIRFEERLNGVEAVIATGSDNTARYFEYYFRTIPHIIRKNRTSIAVLMGEETPEILFELGKDVFTYFGLGCRNVSKIYVPEDYNFPNLLDAWQSYESIIHHHKYANNYDYQKSILLVNGTHFYDTGYLLTTASKNLVSPISVLFYETYTNQADLDQKIQLQREKIQCIVSADGWYKSSLAFGSAQRPDVSDYADQIDTMKFLTSI